MAILNHCLSVTSTATPISPDSATPPVPDPRQTKILLPKKKPMKWSTGVAPGEYGGPPTTTKLRKYWGGEDDPLTSDDFIWNREFMDRMKKLIQDPDSSTQATTVQEKPSGFLSLNRVMTLDSLEVDFSKELTAAPRTMGSRDKDQMTSHHQPLLSSLVVRPSTSDGGGDGGGRGSDYELGEVRREPPQYTRSDRYNDDPGYRMRAGSASPVHRRDADHRYSSEYDHSGGPLRGREFGSARDSGRYRDNSPHYARGRGAGRPFSRGLDGPGPGSGPFRGEGSRNNPNVRQRLGDWICPDPLCGNLNFARREYCNNCNKFRYGPGGSPRRGYPGPPPPSGPPRRFPGPPVDPPLGRSLNGGYRSPPRGWARDGPRDFGAGMPPPRHEGRFPDHQMRRDRLDYSDNHRGRTKFDRPMPMDWGNRDRGRDSFFNERKAFERRLPSPPSPPPPPAHRGRWAHDVRERSRSPLRGGPPPKDYNRPMYMDRGRDDRRGMGRGRIGDAY